MCRVMSLLCDDALIAVDLSHREDNKTHGSFSTSFSFCSSELCGYRMNSQVPSVHFDELDRSSLSQKSVVTFLRFYFFNL